MTARELPLVSIITPVYNQGEYVAATLDCMLAQDYPRLEYLVLDDGSTDDTPNVLAQYKNRAKIERHANIGQSATLNKGWAQCKGEYLGYLSGDDLLKPHAISVLAKALDENPDVAVVYCDFDLIDAQGKVVGAVKSNDFSIAELTEMLICHPGVGALFRRTVFDECGGWNTGLRKIPDFEFWLRASKLGRFMRVPLSLGQYRVHEDSTAIRPIPPERSMEIAHTMHKFWEGREHLPSARFSLSRAHFKAAQSHAQSGRPALAFKEFWRAVQYRPKTAVSVSSWRDLLRAFALRLFNRVGWLSARLR